MPEAGIIGITSAQICRFIMQTKPLQGKKHVNRMQKLCFQDAKCGILEHKTWPFA